jgi:hypothetical protein
MTIDGDLQDDSNVAPVFVIDEADIQYQAIVGESYQDTINNLEKALQMEKDENEKLKKTNSLMEIRWECLAKLFQPDQLHRVMNPNSNSRWSDSSLEIFIKLYYKVGKKGYMYLRDVLKWPLPDPSTIQRHMRKIRFKPGESEDVIELIHLKTQDLSEQDKQYGLVIDEMSVQSKLDWDPTEGEFVGHPTVPPGPKLKAEREASGINPDDVLASHVFNVMIIGILVKFKQLIAYHHTDRSWCATFIASWLVGLIRQIYSRCGMKCMFLTMDQGKQNLAL